jgi:hypothetical protein
MPDRLIIAGGRLTPFDLLPLREIWPVDEIPCFQDLLKAIDDADDELSRGSEIDGYDASEIRG